MAIYLMGANKISSLAQQLSRMVGVPWRTNNRMLRNLHHAVGDRDIATDLHVLTKLTMPSYADSGQASGNGIPWEMPVIFVVQRHNQNICYKAARLIERVKSEFRTDVFTALWVHGVSHRYLQKFTNEFVFRLNRQH